MSKILNVALLHSEEKKKKRRGADWKRVKKVFFLDTATWYSSYTLTIGFFTASQKNKIKRTKSHQIKKYKGDLSFLNQNLSSFTFIYLLSPTYSI